METSFLTRYQDQSRDVLASILDHSQDCIKLIGLDGSLEFMNVNGREAMQIEDFSLVANAEWMSLWPEESRDQIANAFSSARDGVKDRFEGYCPTAKGEPRWWDVSVAPVRDRSGRITHVLATSRDITGLMHQRVNDRMRREKAEQNAAHSEVVAREMRHRLKNQLAVIASVTKLLIRSSTTAADLGQQLEKRLIALAHAQDVLTNHGDAPITASSALELVLAASGAGDRVEVLAMPAAILSEDTVPLLGLLLGEMQTNALKYGALAHENGKITLTGEVFDDVLHLHWHEECCASIPKPEREGTGSQLIKRIGSVGSHAAQIQWHERGVAIEIYLRVQPIS